MLGSSVFDSHCRNMWLEELKIQKKGGPGTRFRRKNREKANTANCLQNKTNEYSRRDEQWRFFFRGNRCIAVCLTEYGHISKTHIHSNQYNLLFINTRVRGGKKAALWNQTLPFLLCQPTIWRTALGNANIQYKTHTHRRLAHRNNKISQATSCTDKTTHYVKGSDAITPAQRR